MKSVVAITAVCSGNPAAPPQPRVFQNNLSQCSLPAAPEKPHVQKVFPMKTCAWRYSSRGDEGSKWARVLEGSCCSMAAQRDVF